MSENNLKSYIDNFFDSLVLYDDKYNGHNYKGLLKAGIDVFLETETTYNAYEIYQTFFMIYQITAEDKSEKSSEGSIVKATAGIPFAIKPALSLKLQGALTHFPLAAFFRRFYARFSSS